jgi:hypothetical protein
MRLTAPFVEHFAAIAAPVLEKVQVININKRQILILYNAPDNTTA